jgi:hypothetical protein
MSDAKREGIAVKPSLPSATRGRLSARAWADVRIAARIAREEGVALDVHGVHITNISRRKPMLKEKCNKVQHGQQRMAEAANPKQPTAVVDEASPQPRSKRAARSAQRLLDFQERKRAAAIAALVEQGTDAGVAAGQVARVEAKRLEAAAAARTGSAPMETIDGRPPGEDEGLQHSDAARSKRARASPPEVGQRASRCEAAPLVEGVCAA